MLSVCGGVEPGMGSRVELFAAIRFDWQRNGSSIRALADKYEVHRRTVRQAIASVVPPERRSPVRATPVLDQVRGWIDEMLREDLAAPRKQRHTARRIFQRLVDEHDASVSYSYVAKYVHRRRPQVAAEAQGRAGVIEGYVPQTHEPGADAEVDFADLWIYLVGELVKCFLFTLRLSFSGRAVHRVFRTQGQEAFLEGHVYAFDQIGGVPHGQIRYDNLRSAVKRVLFGRSRVESVRWQQFRSHYGFESFYCIPGQEGAHEKGGVEGDGGRFRRNHLVPVPRVNSIAELNERLAAADAVDDARHIDGRRTSVGADFAAEAPLLLALPTDRFDTALSMSARVDRYARVNVRQCYYSVPARLIDRRVRVSLSAEDLRVFDGSALVATHERSTNRGGSTLVLDHYLEILMGKPGALPGSTALAQARASGAFTSVHEAFWAAARARHGDAEGTRALIEVLLLHRRMDRDAVLAGIRAALSVGAVTADAVAIEARKHAGTAITVSSAPPAPRPRRSPAALVTLQARQQAHIPRPDSRPEPSVAGYDELLSRRTRRDAS
jgi:transposase